MRDPYLYEDVDVLKNRANIKDYETLRKAEADITNLAMTAIYEREYAKFTAETLCDIHRTIFGQIYEWGGEYRSIQMVKPEEVLGGDTVRYAHPKEIKKQLAEIMKEITKLKRNGENDQADRVVNSNDGKKDIGQFTLRLILTNDHKSCGRCGRGRDCAENQSRRNRNRSLGKDEIKTY